MIKPNFKKMYLISDEKFQTLMANSSQTKQDNTRCDPYEIKQNSKQMISGPL